jgi:hypothetical protein
VSSDDSEERRRADDNDIWMPNLFPGENRGQTSKGELSEDTEEKSFIWANIGPGAHDTNAIEYLALNEMTAVLRWNDTSLLNAL